MLFVGFCALGLVYLPWSTCEWLARLPSSKSCCFAAAVLGLGTLLRVAGASEPSITRTMCRIVVAYLLFELLVVIPVALWLGRAELGLILGTMAVRVTWLLFPVMLTVCADERARRLAGAAVVVAAACLVAWGVYAAATGGGGYYVESGEVRYRILPGSALLLIAWPFVLAVSGAVSRRHTVAFLAIAVVGLTAGQPSLRI